MKCWRPWWACLCQTVKSGGRARAAAGGAAFDAIVAADHSRAMSRDYPSLPMVGLLAIVRRGDRFLLVRRAKEPNRGRWGFPGGVQELGETVVDGARRELAEETGLIAGGGRAITTLDAIDHDE